MIDFDFESSTVDDCAVGWTCVGGAGVRGVPAAATNKAIGFGAGSAGSASSRAFVLPADTKKVQFRFLETGAADVLVKKQSTGATVCKASKAGERPRP